MKVGKHDVVCHIETKDGKNRHTVTLTIDPVVTFENGRATKAALRWSNVTGPTIVKSALWSATAVDNMFNVLQGTLVEKINEFLGPGCDEALGQQRIPSDDRRCEEPWCELTDGHAASWSSFSTPSCTMRMPSGGYCRASVMASSGVPRSQVANSRSQAALISVASNSWPMHSRPLWAACHASYADTPKPILLVDRARTFRIGSTVKAILRQQPFTSLSIVLGTVHSRSLWPASLFGTKLPPPR